MATFVNQSENAICGLKPQCPTDLLQTKDLKTHLN